jgi:hypothetical protein
MFHEITLSSGISPATINALRYLLKIPDYWERLGHVC